MAEYIKIKTVGDTEVNQYLEDGWEIMGETISFEPPEIGTIYYDIGLPAKVMIERLNSIIKDYERFGFKEKLFQEIAKEYGDSLENYQTNSFLHEDNHFKKYMKDYDLYANDK